MERHGDDVRRSSRAPQPGKCRPSLAAGCYVLAAVFATLPGCCHTRNALEFATDAFDDGGGDPVALIAKPVVGIAVLPVAVAFDVLFNLNPVWHVIWLFGTAGGHGDKWMSGC